MRPDYSLGVLFIPRVERLQMGKIETILAVLNGRQSTDSGIPAAPTIARRTADGSWTLTCRCPICSKRHTHGGGSGDTPNLGHRVAHCLRPESKGYILVAAPADHELHDEAKKDLARAKRQATRENRQAVEEQEAYR